MFLFGLIITFVTSSIEDISLPFNVIITHRCYCCLVAKSCLGLSVIPRTVACQAPLSMGFSRQKYWNGFPCRSPGDLPNPGIKPVSLTSPVLAGRFFTTGTT